MGTPQIEFDLDFSIKDQDLCIDRTIMRKRRNDKVIIYTFRLFLSRLSFRFFTNSK